MGGAMRVAIVTGAGGGVGRGIAEGLAENGARIYFTARSPERLAETADTIRRLGGAPYPLLFDHASVDGLSEILEMIGRKEGRLDLLVNNVWGGYENMVEHGQFTWTEPFWKQPLWRWDAMMTVGVKTAYVCSQCAAPIMARNAFGLIVNISYWSAKKHIANVVYGIAKAATDKMTADMAVELDGTGVSVVSLYPGLVRTEKIMAYKEHLDLTNSESPRYIGRVIAALLEREETPNLSGTACVAAELGRRFGVFDVDGESPRPLTLESA